MVLPRLRALLDQHGVCYDCISHERAMTACEVAAAAGLPEHHVAKSLIVTAQQRMMMIVLPASARLDLHLVREQMDDPSVQLADELEAASCFPDCEAGAQPAMGNLYQMTTWVDMRLSLQPLIAFCAGTHCQLVRLAWRDYRRMVRPRLVNLTAVAAFA